MINIDDKMPASQGPVPCEFVITLDKIYQLQQIRFQIQNGTNAAYQVLVSRDGRKYDLLQDHSREKLAGWQEFRFPRVPSGVSCLAARGQMTASVWSDLKLTASRWL